MPREFDVIHDYYFNHTVMSKIANRLGMSETRICHILKRSKEKLSIDKGLKEMLVAV